MKKNKKEEEEEEVDPRSAAGLVAPLYTAAAAAAVCKCVDTASLLLCEGHQLLFGLSPACTVLRNEAAEPGVEEEYQNFTCSPLLPSVSR